MSKTYKEVKEELLELIIAIDRNAVASCDDLSVTWFHLKQRWQSVQETMENYIVEGES